MTTLYRNSHKIYIWMCGDNSIGLVNPTDFQCDLISNFFGSPNDQVSPFTVIASDRMKKAVGVYVFERKGAFVYMGSQGLIRHFQNKVLKGSMSIVIIGDNILCLETSLDDGLLFAGGSTDQDLTKGNAKLFAITFDEQLNLIDSIELRAGNKPCWGVSSIRRFIDKDVVVVGTYQTIFLVEWTGSHFVLLNYVEDIHSCR